jgi:hypothetical protein
MHAGFGLHAISRLRPELASFAKRLFLKTCLLVTAVACLVHAAGSAKAGESVVTESQIKAAFLLNFAKYVEWPAEAFAYTNSPIVVVIFDDDELSMAFQKVAEGKIISGRRIEFKRAVRPEECGICHVLFVGTREPRQVGQILERLRKTSVLTVGACDEFLDKGGIINLAQRDRKVRLDISLTSARQARLRISSQLLSVADHVKGK